jgi:hypothetical protein
MERTEQARETTTNCEATRHMLSTICICVQSPRVTVNGHPVSFMSNLDPAATISSTTDRFCSPLNLNLQNAVNIARRPNIQMSIVVSTFDL